MVRPVTDDDIGLKVLREPSATATQVVDIVAVHGIGAHPDDSWCKNVGTPENPQWANWLEKEDMLPAVAPEARIMRYGYQSQWFGEGAMRQNASTVAQRLLLSLRRRRKDLSHRPLIFIAHCFGGLVVLKALLDAQQYEKDWPGIFTSTTGLVFLGTPFRGAEGMSQVEMLDAARRKYHEDQIQTSIIKILEPGNEFLKDVVDQFCKTRMLSNKAHVACFFELKASNVGQIVGKQDRTRFVVSESSGCLDLSDSTMKFSLSRNHFNMNKFGKPAEEDFETLSEVLQSMIGAAHGLILARSQYHGKHQISFSLRGVPVLSQFVPREAEKKKLEEFFFCNSSTENRRKAFVLHGLGGIGKTQLAVDFARVNQSKFSAIFWLDGSSEKSVKQSFVSMAQRLQREDPTAITVYDGTITEVAVAVQECFQWLSLPSNQDWLLIFDNVDRDYHDNDDEQAYKVTEYFPLADHGSILITSRLASLLPSSNPQHKVGIVDSEQARAILESNAGKSVQDAEMILNRLDGLPLALTQAGSYLRETNMSTSTYLQHYNSTWKRLMQKEGKYSLPEHGNQNILTTWALSYEQVQRQSAEAACLLKLWGCLDHGDMWYELVEARSGLKERVNIPTWLFTITDDRLEFTDTLRHLSRYSLIDIKEGVESCSMHSVLHTWCHQLLEDEERDTFYCLAAELIANNVQTDHDKFFCAQNKRVLPHGMRLAQLIQDDSTFDGTEVPKTSVPPEMIMLLAHLLCGFQISKQAEEMDNIVLRRYEAFGPLHPPLLELLNHLGRVYLVQNELEKAEKILDQLLQEEEKGVGYNHPLTLGTVHSLGLVYAKQNRLKEAENMQIRVLQEFLDTSGHDQSLGIDALDSLGDLCRDQRKLYMAEEIYNTVLQEKVRLLGYNHVSTTMTLFKLADLDRAGEKLDKIEQMFDRALQERDEMFGPDVEITPNICMSLGKINLRKGRFKKARELFQRVCDFFEKALDHDNEHCQLTRRLLESLDDKIASINQVAWPFLTGTDYDSNSSPEADTIPNRTTSIATINSSSPERNCNLRPVNASPYNQTRNPVELSGSSLSILLRPALHPESQSYTGSSTNDEELD